MTNGASRSTDFDLVLFGATGFTGRLVAEYLVTKKPKLRWALAGRSADKLAAVRSELGPDARDLPIVVGDSMDPASVDAMVRRTRVVCTTVGPYSRYGGALVGACAEHGVHYCDLTGEPPFVRRIIDDHHARAEATGARIVPCCGFDSLPSDLGVFMLHDHLQKQGKKLAEAHYRVMRLKGGASGGTIASMLTIAELARDRSVRRLLADPYGLDPKGGSRGPDGRDQAGPRRDATTGRWTAPFVMASINMRVVRRTNALLDYPYGTSFRYDEATDTGTGPAGLLRATAMSAAIGGLMGAVFTPQGRALVARFLPKPGEGPGRQARERGSFRIDLHGTSDDGEAIRGYVEGNKDPGYAGTAIMLGEAALCLAEDALPARGGVLTSASCMGMTLVERLRSGGIQFRVA
jgi:short subunit dehydrogenase-like uncharacterized protein